MSWLNSNETTKENTQGLEKRCHRDLEKLIQRRRKHSDKLTGEGSDVSREMRKIIGSRIPGSTPIYIESLPFSIDREGRYFLSRNLEYNGRGAAILIKATNVLLNFDVFALRISNGATGIAIGESSNIILQNPRISSLHEKKRDLSHPRQDNCSHPRQDNSHPRQAFSQPTFSQGGSQDGSQQSSQLKNNFGIIIVESQVIRIEDADISGFSIGLSIENSSQLVLKSIFIEDAYQHHCQIGHSMSIRGKKINLQNEICLNSGFFLQDLSQIDLSQVMTLNSPLIIETLDDFYLHNYQSIIDDPNYNQGLVHCSQSKNGFIDHLILRNRQTGASAGLFLNGCSGIKFSSFYIEMESSLGNGSKILFGPERSSDIKFDHGILQGKVGHNLKIIPTDKSHHRLSFSSMTFTGANKSGLSLASMTSSFFEDCLISESSGHGIEIGPGANSNYFKSITICDNQEDAIFCSAESKDNQGQQIIGLNNRSRLHDLGTNFHNSKTKYRIA